MIHEGCVGTNRRGSKTTWTGGRGGQGAERQGRKREEDAYLVVFGREFQSAGFKWLKKTLLQSDSEWLRRTEKPGTC